MLDELGIKNTWGELVDRAQSAIPIANIASILKNRRCSKVQIFACLMRPAKTSFANKLRSTNVIGNVRLADNQVTGARYQDCHENAGGSWPQAIVI